MIPLAGKDLLRFISSINSGSGLVIHRHCALLNILLMHVEINATTLRTRGQCPAPPPRKPQPNGVFLFPLFFIIEL